MALFKSLRGKRENLPSTKTDGYAYFCTDDGTFWIDYKDENGVVQRKQINAKDAETLMGASLSTILNSSNEEIPTSKAVLDALVGKSLSGKTVPTNETTTITAGVGAEVFNDYAEPTFSGDIPQTGNVASGNYSHAEGSLTVATGDYSHAEGNYTFALDDCTHTEGWLTQATASCAHAEGSQTIASGGVSHAEGMGTQATSQSQHVQGYYNIIDTEGSASTRGKYAHIVGNGNMETRSNAHTLDWSGNGWFAGDVYTGSASGTDKDSGSKKLATEEYVDSNIPTNYAGSSSAGGAATSAEKLNTNAGSVTQPVYFKDGVPTVTNTLDSVAFDGYVTKGKKSGTTVGSKATAEGKDNTASGNYSHAEGNSTVSSGQYSHSEGYRTTASGTSSHSEGYSSKIVPDTITSSTSNADIITEWNAGSFSFANGPYSHIEGFDNLALGSASHAEGRTTISSGTSSHSEGFGTVASEYGSHAEGWQTTSSDYASHSEGRETTASGRNSHAEGYGTLSSGENSHAEGVSTVASGRGSHAEGEGTSAMSALQHVEGKYNIKDYVKYAHIVGNGTSDEARSNAHTLDWNGNAWYSGKVSIGTTSNVPTPTADNDLVTKQYVDNKFSTRTASVTLAADSWTGTDSPYSQEVTIDGVTENSKVDLNPTGDQLNSIASNRTILNTANDNGTVTVYAVGNKPTEDYTMQVTITEV